MSDRGARSKCMYTRADHVCMYLNCVYAIHVCAQASHNYHTLSQCIQYRIKCMLYGHVYGTSKEVGECGFNATCCMGVC
jgi:hypothetical protein